MNPNVEPAFVSHATFDEYADRYEQALSKGVALSGESPDYFAQKRIEHTCSWLQRLGRSPRRIADFGCGVGGSTLHFQRYFPGADLLGLDVSTGSIRRAREIHGDAASFTLLGEFKPGSDRDLVYCNGVFHHIAPEERLEWARTVREMLAPGGYFALWENNPWNPGTRMVMRRIPFDRDAIPLSAIEAKSLVGRAGFEIVGTRYHFYFPRSLSALRPIERLGERLPLGAQYDVLARKPDVS